MTGPVRDFVGYGNKVPKVSWPGGARIAVSLVVNYEEGAERSLAEGDDSAEGMGESAAVPDGMRNLRNESLFEYGTRAGLWRLLDIFQRQDVKATFFICSRSLEQTPEGGREITAGGHEAAGHGHRWLPTYTLGREEERRQLQQAVASIEALTGQRPLGWYARSPSIHTRGLVVEEGGFVYDCNSFADDLPYFVDVKGRKWLVLPYSQETNDIKFVLAPGYAEPDDFFRQLRDAFDCLYQEGERSPKMLSVGLHLRMAGRPARAAALERFIRHAKDFPAVWFARRIDIARWWLEHQGDLPVHPSEPGGGA